MSTSSRSSSARQWLTPQRVWVALTAAVLASVAVVAWSVWKGASWESLMDVQIDWAGCGWPWDVWPPRRRLRGEAPDLGPGRIDAQTGHLQHRLVGIGLGLDASVVGGSAVASFILHRNGLSWGEAWPPSCPPPCSTNSISCWPSLSSPWRSAWLRFCPNRRTGLKARWPPFLPAGTPSWPRWPRC